VAGLAAPAKKTDPWTVGHGVVGFLVILGMEGIVPKKRITQVFVLREE
jgi:hypothetical protein